ncbi:MAG: hypothetical protein GYA14_13835 [Ignavibacteria bacterium]|nr:hypothetical protein [Ignavibacteria bacterium]
MYCNANDVAMFLGVAEFNDNTNPTLARVNDLISIISNEIDFFAKIQNIKFDDSYANILRKKSAIGVAGVILITYLNNNQNAGSQANEFLREYREFLANMRRNFIEKDSCSSNFLDETIKDEWWDYDYYDK